MDSLSRLKLRIFVSSPGDVPVERDRAAEVIARLQEEFIHYAVLEPFFWEDQPARATETFQSQFPEASGMDIVVGILWARIGTPLPLEKTRPDGRRYESGTVYELETAAEAYRSRGTPDLVVYRRTSDPSVPLHDEAERQRRLEQLEALETFIRRWFFHDDGSFKAAFHTFKSPDQFEQQLETHLRKLIREKVEKAEQPGGPGKEEIVFHGVPYPGLKVFGLEDAQVFYGRARALAAVKEALRSQAARNGAFLLIFGMSGSGKSSLVRAGLVHALTATPGWIEGVDVWRWCLVRPGDATGDPLDGLAQALFGDTALPELRGGGIDAARLARTLRDNPGDVDLILGPALRAVADSERERRAADRPLEARLLVVVDQMEELFTRDWLDEPGRARYVAALAALARSGAASVVATMRSEFFARCAELPELVALKASQGQLDLLPPTFAEIGQMIRYPARDAALRWGKDPANPGQTLDDVLQEGAWRDPKALPLLQFTLNELFRRRDGRTLTCESYRALGGLEGALANHAEATLAALPPEVQAVLPALLRALVTSGEGDHEPVVSRRVPLEPLRIDPIRRRLLDVLIDARLLVTDRDDRMQPVVGIAHEALLTHWPRLKDLLDKDREFLRARTRVAAAAERWRREGRHDDFLLNEGKPLAEARELIKTRRDELDPETNEFIDQSIRCRTRQRRRRTRAIATTTGIVLTIVSAFAAFSFVEWREAETQRKEAREQEKNALIARDEAERQRDVARSNAYVAHMNLAQRELEDTHVGRVLDLLNGERPRGGETDLRGFEWFYLNRLCHVDLRTLTGHTDGVAGLAYSPDGRLIASASRDQTVKVWDAGSGQVTLTLMGHTDRVTGVAFSPDGRRIASASEDHTVKVWDAGSGQTVLTLKGHVGHVYGVTFSPDGRRIASASEDRMVKVWDAGSGQVALTLKGHTYWVMAVAFSPDGRRIASASSDHSVKVWDASSGQVTLTLKSHAHWVTDVAFSPDGRRIASASDDHTVKVWDAGSGQVTLTLTGHTNRVTSVAFSPDGRRIASASWDETVKVWDVGPTLETLTLKGHTGIVNGVAFSPDGTRLASASWDETVKVWDAGSGQEVRTLKGHTEHVNGVAFSLDGRRIASVSSDETVKVWDASSGQVTLTLKGHTFVVVDVAFSPDGRRIASVSSDETVKVWDAGSGQVSLTLKGHTGGVSGVAFSPDGRRIASASGDHTVKVWDAGSGQVMLTLKGHTDGVNGVTFSPDGRRIASASLDETVKVWDASSGQVALTLKGHTYRVTAVAFSPDGGRIASASDDHTVKVWDAGSGQVSLTLKGHTGRVTGVAYSPDGRRIASASHDRTVKVWDAGSGQETLTLKGHTGGVAGVAYSPDGRRIASASDDKTVKVWDARDK